MPNDTCRIQIHAGAPRETRRRGAYQQLDIALRPALHSTVHSRIFRHWDVSGSVNGFWSGTIYSKEIAERYEKRIGRVALYSGRIRNPGSGLQVAVISVLNSSELETAAAPALPHQHCERDPQAAHEPPPARCRTTSRHALTPHEQGPEPSRLLKHRAPTDLRAEVGVRFG